MLNEETPPVEGEDFQGLEAEETDWLAIVQEAYRTSTDYLDANFRSQFEKNISNFRSKHPPGSKYYKDAYKFRSKLFRPKTRSAIRRAEATFAEAMFATSDTISVEPEDQSSKEDDRTAEVWQAALNHRIRTSIPWFLTSVAAYQETKVYGVVVSRQDWEHEEVTVTQDVIDPISNEPMRDPTTGETVTEDVQEVVVSRPRIELIRLNNVRFDPAAKWYDPINTSPYFIELMPMYVGDVMGMMKRVDSKTGNPEWKEYTKGEIIAAGTDAELSQDTMNSAREDNKKDPNDTDHKEKEFEIVWVFRNFIKKDGVDYEFYSLTDKRMLTDPIEVDNPLGRRPYRIGISSLEAHRCIPSGDVELAQNLQAEANHIVNQRLDNVQLVLNKGKYVARNKNVDLITLKRSYPGRIVQTTDPRADIVDEVVPDVTGSSYAEQDRLNMDTDDLLGGMSSASVSSNRKLNETVGGMNIMERAGNAVQGFSVRIFVETWVEPVLMDIVKLIQAYEDDALLARFAQNKGVQLDRGELDNDMRVSVSVGFGALDPKAKAKAIVQSLQVLGKMVPWSIGKIDLKVLASELFGVIGYRDGTKFFTEIPEGPPEQKPNPEIELKRQELEMRSQVEMAKVKILYETKMAEIALREKVTLEQLYRRLAIDAGKLDLEMDKLNLKIMQEMGQREKTKRDREEMELKTIMGSGI